MKYSSMIFFVIPMLFIFISCDGDSTSSNGGYGEPCYDNGTCDTGMVCTKENICKEDPSDTTGGLGQKCNDDGTCDDSLLYCNKGTCEKDSDSAKGGKDQPCYDDNTCDGMLQCKNDNCSYENTADGDVTADGDTTTPTDGDSTVPTDGDTTTPTDGDTTTPVDGDTSNPVDGDVVDTDFTSKKCDNCGCTLNSAKLNPATKKKVVIFYEHNSSDNFSRGRKAAVMARNLIGHFATEVDIENVDNYTSGKIATYDAAIYLGTLFDYNLKVEFLTDAYNSTKPFLWIKNNIWKLQEATFDIKTKFGFEYKKMNQTSGEVFQSVEYKNQSLSKDGNDNNMAIVELASGSKCDIKATLKNSSINYPLLISCGNFWYMSSDPFAYRFGSILVFADALHDFLGTNTTAKHSAILRLEDVNPGSRNDNTLKVIAADLKSKNIPFSVSVIPVYSDPKGEFKDPGTIIKMRNDMAFQETMHYMADNGGTLIANGYTHQNSGLTASDYEFWDNSTNKPVSGDSWSFAAGRVDKALDEFKAAFSYTPDIWETPLFKASQIDYFAFASKIGTVFERPLVYDSVNIFKDCDADNSGSIDATNQILPYVAYDSFYGFRIVPENAYYFAEANDSTQNDEYGIKLDATGKEFYAKEYKVVRDSVVSFYFYHWQDYSKLTDAIKKVQDAGYEFRSICDVINDGTPEYK